MLEGEMSNLAMVWSIAAATMSYCHLVGKVVGEGKGRLAAVVPAVGVLVLLPIRLNSVHLGGPSSFFLGWLSTFKILLFAFGKGPLSSHPQLSLLQFIALASLPIKFHSSNSIHPSSSSSSSSVSRNSSPFAAYAFAPIPFLILMAALIPLYGQKENLHPKLVLFLYSLHMYIGLEFIFSTASFFTGKTLQVELEPQFHRPYLSTSLQDFWGRRWNISVNRLLHPAVYQPVATASTRLLGRKWAHLPAIFATFAVSSAMHELVFYYIRRDTRGLEPWVPSWDATCFFLLHGACLALEVGIKKELKGKEGWNLPRVLTWMMTVVFVIYTALSLFVPALVRCRLYEKARRELLAVADFSKEVYGALRYDGWKSGSKIWNILVSYIIY